MNEADFAMQRDRVRKVFDDWRNVLGLDEWEVKLNYHDQEFEKVDGSMSADALGLALVDWEYRRASIDFRCDLMAEEDDDSLEYCVVHEAMHILLNGQRAMRDVGRLGAPYRQYERLFEEHTATTLARAFIRARKEPVKQ